jgi:hypothetical protein
MYLHLHSRIADQREPLSTSGAEPRFNCYVSLISTWESPFSTGMVVGYSEVGRGVSVNSIRIRLGHESLDVTLAYLKGKDAESEEAQEHPNNSSLAAYAQSIAQIENASATRSGSTRSYQSRRRFRVVRARAAPRREVTVVRLAAVERNVVAAHPSKSATVGSPKGRWKGGTACHLIVNAIVEVSVPATVEVSAGLRTTMVAVPGEAIALAGT